MITLEEHGRAYGDLHLAIVFTDGVEGLDAKRVTCNGWNRTAPLANGDFGAALVAGRGLRRNPAVALRASGLIGIDVDGPDGVRHLKQLVPRGLPPTITVETGRPGWHLWYRPAEGSPPAVVKVELGAEGVEVAKDGYLVVPPARHTSGHLYRFAQGRSPWQLEPTVLPVEIARLFDSHHARSRATEIASTDPISEGGRHRHLRRLAGAMRRVGAGESTIAAALLVENQARCQPPKDECLVRALARDIASRYQPGAA